MAETIQLRRVRAQGGRRKPRRRAATEREPRARGAREPGGDPGRAWINGTEVGGTDPRFAHLDCSYD